MSVLPLAPSIPAPPTVRLCAPDRKLYLPYSSLPIVGGVIHARAAWSTQTTVHWFVVGRTEPITAYDTTIQGYKSLSALARSRAESMVDEFFRESEFQQLREYLQTRRQDARTSMLTTPVSSIKPDSSTRTGTLRPFVQNDVEQSEQIAIYRLSDEEGYCLPFMVWGAYIVEKPMRHGSIERSVE